MKTKHYTSATILAVMLLLVGLWVQSPPAVHADDTNFSDGITVDSTNDTPDSNIGDNICDDGAGACTLRAAIQESNATTGVQTINFGISGTGLHAITPATVLPDITAQVTINGYSQPGSLVNTADSPAAFNGTLTIEINGENITSDDALFVDTGAAGTIIRGLVINRVDGNAIMIRAADVVVQGNYLGTDNTGLIGLGNSNAGVNNAGLGTSLNALVGGLTAASRNIISSNESAGSYPGEGWTIQGNYIGVDATGMATLGNATIGGSGGLSIDSVDDVTVGGVGTAQNVISGNLSHGVAPHDTQGLTIENNLIGLARDGTTVLGNGGAGIVLTESDTALLVDNRISGAQADGMFISEVTSSEISDNVLIENTNRGIAIDQSSALTITGNTVSSSASNGLDIAGSSDLQIEDNTIDTSQNAGIKTATSTALDIINNELTDNDFGMDILSSQNVIIGENVVSGNAHFAIRINNGVDGARVYGNTVTANTGGISVSNASNITIGGLGVDEGNAIFDNPGDAAVLVAGIGGSVSNVIMQANYIGVDRDGALNQGFGPASGGIVLTGTVSGSLIGGGQAGAGNVIAGNNAAGIVVASLAVDGFGTFTPTKNSMLGNTIYDNELGSYSNFGSLNAPGLGIDLFKANLNGGFAPVGVDDGGPNTNDPIDADTGANGYINFPVLSSAKQTGTSLALSYNLDAADSPSNEYRIEFFANDTADSSGYGEGQTFLGAVTAANGNGNTATLTLPSGMDLTGKVISATTTAVDNTTDSGFGSTSEFSAVLGVEVVASVNNPTDADTNVNLAQTGQDTRAPLLFGAALITASAATMIAKRKYVYKARP
jgi:CSLREA domain-containing protein